MKTIEFTPRQSDIGPFRKENAFYKEYAVIDLNGKYPAAKITLRLYATDARHYACIWIDSKNEEFAYAYGGGYAGGFGYHRASAAAQSAMKSAGIKLDSPIDGRGDTAIEEALKAIAEKIGVENPFIHQAHA